MCCEMKPIGAVVVLRCYHLWVSAFHEIICAVVEGGKIIIFLPEKCPLLLIVYWRYKIP